MNSSKKNDDDNEISFKKLEKGLVLQEKILFNETPINARKCCSLLTKLLYLLITQGDTFTTTEATDVFFSITRLFQSTDVPLRRLVYLILKELIPLAEDVIIAIATLTKDMTSQVDVYRSNAIRVLCRIADSSILPQIERHIKQSIVDKDPSVASAALVAGTHLVKSGNKDLIRRWVNEVQEASNSKSTMVQYHALGLLHTLKNHDRLAISKLVVSMSKTSLRSPYAHCLLIRYAAQVYVEDKSGSDTYKMMEYLESCLRHKNDMVMYEAARAICNLPLSQKQLSPAITILQMLLSSSQTTLRFAAVRTLNKLAQTQPLAVTPCNIDMENLITDSNRSISTLAITTLLKTGSESSVDRLMKQIQSFMGEISDEFKIVVVQAIEGLCLKYPQKHYTLMNFLSGILREEGGFNYKRVLVDTMLTIINSIPDAKEMGLTHLCEFIEDCEYTELATKIIHLLGKEGPSTSTPSKFIRYIYNRISLEKANVRASAVSALAKFGKQLEELRPNVIVLLKRCLFDVDDEVRDRVTYYLRMLEHDADNAKVVTDFPVPLFNLEVSLQNYLNSGQCNSPFDYSFVSMDIEEPLEEQDKKNKQNEDDSSYGSGGKIDSPVFENYSESLAQIPEFSNLGEIFKSSKPVELTEPETEFVVKCVKHIFPEHIVFQFNCLNTLKDQVLENVNIRMEPTEEVEGTEVEFLVSCPSLPYDKEGVAYVCVKKPLGESPSITYNNTLLYTSKDCDPETGDVAEDGFEDEYQLEDVEVATADFVLPVFIPNFSDSWEQLGEEFEVVETYNLPGMAGLKEAVAEVSQFLGMHPCDRSGSVPPKKSRHILYLSGKFTGDVSALVRARMRIDPSGSGVNMELTVRSQDANVSQILASTI